MARYAFDDNVYRARFEHYCDGAGGITELADDNDAVHSS